VTGGRFPFAASAGAIVAPRTERTKQAFMIAVRESGIKSVVEERNGCLTSDCEVGKVISHKEHWNVEEGVRGQEYLKRQHSSFLV
jgi:hypothetical protein